MSEVISHTRLKPTVNPSSPVSTRLSILDSIAAPSPPANGIWIYDKPNLEEQGKALLVSRLLESLQKTVEAYPQWAGQLQQVPFEYEGDPRKRFGRLVVEHGLESDPGFDVVVAESSRRIADFTPSPRERAVGPRFWDTAGFPGQELLSGSLVAGYDGKTFEGLPNVSIQLTTFACGGISLGFRIMHAFADASSIMQFMNGWAENNRSLVERTPLPTLTPLFDPSRIEKATGGNLEVEGLPDPGLLRLSRSMPVHRFDRWLDTESRPSFFAEAMDVTKPPGVLIERDRLSPADPVPWEQCDFHSPASSIQVHFNSEEIYKLWKTATAESRIPVSRLDALLAHLWKRLSAARQLDNSNDIYLNLTLGVRPRLSPPLPENFLGSPTMHIYTAMRPNEIIEAPLGTVAEAIRMTTNKFDHLHLEALLHDFTYEAGANRLWQLFFGRHHTTVTTWLGIGSSTLEFASGVVPRHFHFLLPNNIDGIIHIMDASPLQSTGNSGHSNQDGAKRHWSDNDVIVALVMDTRVIERLLEDPLLRGQ